MSMCLLHEKYTYWPINTQTVPVQHSLLDCLCIFTPVCCLAIPTFSNSETKAAYSAAATER